MKRLLILIAVAMLAASCSLPTQILKPTTHRLEIAGHIVCSATAVGPHSLLTATHCLVGGPIVVSGHAAAVVKRIDDEHDHTILITTHQFTHYAHISQRPIDQGAKVFYFGQPGGDHQILREGYIAGLTQWHQYTHVVLIGTSGWRGDSGAGVFNRSGQLVGVISLIHGNPIWNMMGMIPMHFTHKQLAQIR